MSLILRQINNHSVQAVPIEDVDVRPVKGGEICAEPYANIAIIAKKRSGKTSACFKILKECAGKKTHIVVICSTLFKDKNWLAIAKYFRKKGIAFTGYTDLYENGVNNLSELVEKLDEEARAQEENEGDDEEEMDDCDKLLMMLGAKHDEPEKDEKPKKEKYLAPEYIVVFDDLSNQIKNPIIEQFLKKNRHYKCKVILSSQWLHDMLPSQRKQIDLWLVFKGLPKKKVEEVAKSADVSLEFEAFYKIYKKATKHPYSFLYIDTSDMHMRRNFSHQIGFKEEEEDKD